MTNSFYAASLVLGLAFGIIPAGANLPIPGAGGATETTVNGTFEADHTPIAVWEPVNFTYNVSVEATHEPPPNSTSYGGFVGHLNGTLVSSINRVPTEAREGRGSFRYIFSEPGTYRVGVNISGPDVVDRWVGSTFAIVPGPASSTTVSGDGTPLPAFVGLGALWGAALVRGRRDP